MSYSGEPTKGAAYKDLTQWFSGSGNPAYNSSTWARWAARSALESPFPSLYFYAAGYSSTYYARPAIFAKTGS